MSKSPTVLLQERLLEILIYFLYYSLPYIHKLLSGGLEEQHTHESVLIPQKAALQIVNTDYHEPTDDLFIQIYLTPVLSRDSAYFNAAQIMHKVTKKEEIPEFV